MIQKQMKNSIIFSIIAAIVGCDEHKKAIETDIISDTVSTTSGFLLGQESELRGIRFFKGIPYAQPPISSLRWAEPLAAKKSNQLLDCQNFKNNCFQGRPLPELPYTSEFLVSDDTNISEDCLFMNIWTPALSRKDKLPVLVYIHGGGLGGGSGSVPIYDGIGMAQKNVVFVNFNYRLNLFGFFTPDNNPGHQNVGLQDQILALKWVRENINAFGGDPQNVTIAGQSAGAWCISALLTTAKSEGLFQKAIAMSGGLFAPADKFIGMNPLFSPRKTLENSRNFFAQADCKTVEELRDKTSEELSLISYRYGFVVDTVHVAPDLYERYRSGRFHRVPLLIGWNGNDAWGFGWQARTFAELASVSHQNSVYLYFFNPDLPGNLNERKLGSFHSAEIPFAFNNLSIWKRPWQRNHILLANTMSDYISNFIRSGNPNAGDLLFWPTYQTNSQKVMQFGNTVQVVDVPGEVEFEHFNRMLKRLPQNR